LLLDSSNRVVGDKRDIKDILCSLCQDRRLFAALEIFSGKSLRIILNIQAGLGIPHEDFWQEFASGKEKVQFPGIGAIIYL
jgi:hypothetical protein